MHYAKFLLLASVCGVIGAQPAHAEIFQWGNQGVTTTLTFPDTWRRVSDQQPDDVITILAPGTDNAMCRMRVNEDRRAVIYPRDYARTVQHINYSQDFWNGYAGQLGPSNINSVTNDAGVGRAFASWADISFVTYDGKQMRAMAYGGVYHDHSYVFECSSTAESYANWEKYFLSVLKSVDMRPEYMTSVNGNYRDFQNDPKLKIHGKWDKDLTLYP